MANDCLLVAALKRRLTKNHPRLRDKGRHLTPALSPIEAERVTFFASFCRWNRELFLRGRRGRRVLDEFVGPRDEVFHVRPVFMSAVVLAPGEFTVEQA